MSTRTTHHVMIPDLQIKPGVPTQHLDWIAQYVCDEFAGKRYRLIMIGDGADMPSLSSYDRGKKAMEGRRYVEDVEAFNKAWTRFSYALPGDELSADYTLGNHEYRIERAAEDNAQIDGLVSLNHLAIREMGWTRHDFLKPVERDGVTYSHYFANPMSGRPYGGQSIDTRLKTIGFSFSMGHQQTFMYGHRYLANGRSLHGLVAGACYLHDEDYLGHQGNFQWRGIVVCHDVRGGAYDVMPVSLDYLCRRYEGMTLQSFRRRFVK